MRLRLCLSWRMLLPIRRRPWPLRPSSSSWLAFERIFSVIHDQGLPPDFSVAQYRAWLARYPQEQSLYARFLEFLVAQKDYAAAQELVADYHKHFPADEIFPDKS